MSKFIKTLFFVGLAGCFYGLGYYFSLCDSYDALGNYEYNSFEAHDYTGNSTIIESDLQRAIAYRISVRFKKRKSAFVEKYAVCVIIGFVSFLSIIFIRYYRSTRTCVLSKRLT